MKSTKTVTIETTTEKESLAFMQDVQYNIPIVHCIGMPFDEDINTGEIDEAKLDKQLPNKIDFDLVNIGLSEAKAI
jgi:hypothetical protein